MNHCQKTLKPKYELSHAERQILARKAAEFLAVSTSIALAAIKIDEALDIIKDKK